MTLTHEAAARRPTPESRLWKRDERARKKHAKEGTRALRNLIRGDLAASFEKIKAKFSKRSQAHIRKRNLLTLRAVAAHPQIPTLLDQYVGADPEDTKVESRKKTVVSTLRYILTRKITARDGWAKIEKILAQGYETTTLEREQAPLKEALPEDILRFLPKKLTVAVDDDGNVKEMTDRFVNQFETLKVKRRRQKKLLKNYGRIVKTVQKDLRSRDPITKMSAVVTAIVMETGIRPGQRGNGITLEMEGEEIDVDTFGAVTLQMSHVQVIRDNFVEIEFPGKMGTTNRASLTDERVIKVLKSYVKRAKKEFGKAGAAGEVLAPLFVAADGTEFGYTDLTNYFNNRAALSGLNPTDFRKLRSTQVLLQELKAQQEDLHARIREFVANEVSDLQGRIVEAITEAVEAAYLQAQTALSHEDVTTTVEKYINPEVLLRFLSTGAVEDKLENVILQGKTRLSLDVAKFVEKAGAGKKPQKKKRRRKR